MEVVILLILASLGMAVFFLACFIWAARSGQYEDTCTPAFRILTDETTGGEKNSPPANETKHPQQTAYECRDV
jgi:cbb3-type cytochrome oxidase maturation protein